MDLEDNERAMNSFDTQVEELKGTIESLEAQLAQNQTQMSDMEAKLEESKAQVKPLSPKSVMSVTPEERKHLEFSLIKFVFRSLS